MTLLRYGTYCGLSNRVRAHIAPQGGCWVDWVGVVCAEWSDVIPNWVDMARTMGEL